MFLLQELITWPVWTKNIAGRTLVSHSLQMLSSCRWRHLSLKVCHLRIKVLHHSMHRERGRMRELKRPRARPTPSYTFTCTHTREEWRKKVECQAYTIWWRKTTNLRTTHLDTLHMYGEGKERKWRRSCIHSTAPSIVLCFSLSFPKSLVDC